MAHKFAKLGEDGKKLYLYKDAVKRDGTPYLKKSRQILWGDFLRIDENAASPQGMLTIMWAQGGGKPPIPYYVYEDDVSDHRPLEVIFLDVGQGDSAIVIGAARGDEEKILIVDGGIGDNLSRYLQGRFKYRNNNLKFTAAIITHPDKDHYEGFRDVFEAGTLKFEAIYHNGLKEQHSTMGPRLGETEKFEGKSYHTDLMETHMHALGFYGDTMDSRMDKMFYPTLMNTAIANDVADKIAMLSIDHGYETNDGRMWVPGLSPDDGAGFDVEIVGPVTGPKADGITRLRRISSDGKTKNGHSILLRLSIGGFTLMLGGDLNASAEKLILQHYAQMETWPKTQEDRARLIESARNRLESDLLKVCHHGAADATDEFLLAVNPAAFVISSGDEEGHVHPRPDLLGRLGRNGRGFAPLILSTELQRSTREDEDIKDKLAIETNVETLSTRLGDSASDMKAREKAQSAIKEALARLARSNVSVYGAIHVKTDGERLIVAFRIETNSKTKRWHYYEYRQDVNGTLLPLHEVSV